MASSSEEKSTTPPATLLELSKAASELNSASDELRDSVGILDQALKRLNVGIPVWVTFRRKEKNARYWIDRIGYAKLPDGNWGIAICRVHGFENRDEETLDEFWPFNDAPRELRLSSVEGLAKVIDGLKLAAEQMTGRVKKKVAEVRRLAAEIGLWEKLDNQRSTK